MSGAYLPRVYPELVLDAGHAVVQERRGHEQEGDQHGRHGENERLSRGPAPLCVLEVGPRDVRVRSVRGVCDADADARHHGDGVHHRRAPRDRTRGCGQEAHNQLILAVPRKRSGPWGRPPIRVATH